LKCIKNKLFYNSYIYATIFNSLKINHLQMKVLEIFTEKLRYKNYSPRSISTYTSYLKNFITLNNIRDRFKYNGILFNPKYYS